MNNAIKNFSIMILSILSITCYAENTATPLAENYICQRTDAANKTTSYPLSVTSTGSTYTFQWKIDNKTAFYGTGVVHPKKNNYITVVFWDPNNSDVYGVELFEIKPDGSLSSDWILQSQTQLGSETCTKK